MPMYIVLLIQHCGNKIYDFNLNNSAESALFVSQNRLFQMEI